MIYLKRKLISLLEDVINLIVNLWKIRKDALAFNFGKLNYSENRICVIICLNIVSWYKCLFLKSMPFKNGKRKFSWNDVIRDNIHESINNAGYRQTNPKNTGYNFSHSSNKQRHLHYNNAVSVYRMHYNHYADH